jgi:hypothetical protein
VIAPEARDPSEAVVRKIVIATTDPGILCIVSSSLRQAGILVHAEPESIPMQAHRNPFFTDPQPVRVVVAVAADHEDEANEILRALGDSLLQRDNKVLRLQAQRIPLPSGRTANLHRLQSKSSDVSATESGEPDPNLDPSWFEFVPALENVVKIRKYFKTRRLILDGVPLWDFTAVDLQQANLMHPWPFNLYQSLLAAAPSTALYLLGNALSPETSASFAKTIESFIESLFVPLSLGIGAYAAARYSFDAGQSDAASRRRARLAYWYLDGALGLWPQIIIAFGFLVFIATVQFAPSLAPWLLLIFLPVLFQQYWLTNVVIPARLFAINGYRAALNRGWPWLRFRKSARWSRYRLLTSAAIALTLALLSIVGGLVLLALEPVAREPLHK